MEAHLLGGDGDLAGLLLGLLVDEPHHLLDLLGDIGVVHLGGGGSDVPSGCSARSGDGRAGWGLGMLERGGSTAGRRGSRESTGMVEAGRSWGKPSRGSNVIGLAPVVAVACLYVLPSFRGPGPWIRDASLLSLVV